MQSIIRGFALITILGTSVIATNADEKAPEAGRTAAPSGIQLRKEVRISVDFQKAEVSTMLKTIAKAGNINVILSDDIKPQVLLFVRLRDVTPVQAVEIICRMAGLSYGRWGGETFLIVPQNRLQVPLQAPAPSPPQNRGPFLFGEPATPAPDWKKFQFNEMPYYLVPLK